MKRAFITGITGQDGSYLAELLLSKGYEVHGIIRRSSSFNTGRIDHLMNIDPEKNKIKLYHGDLADSSNLNRLLKKIQPDEIYNLAAQSHVKVSFEVPEYTAEVNSLGTLRLLDAVRDSDIDTKFYQASTSEMFGGISHNPLNEKDLFYPKSPYACSKLYSYWITINYRESYGMFASNGILFNHESPRRGRTFVSKKITEAVSNIKKGKQNILLLGNLNAMRDWGYAPEYVEAMHLILKYDNPDDFVIATGETHTVREFVEKAFQYIDCDIYWKGKGINEQGFDKNTNECLVKIDKRYIRPVETEYLCGDPSKAEKLLGWKPKTKFNDLIKIMMDEDLK